jgi:hypothetical protein
LFAFAFDGGFLSHSGSSNVEIVKAIDVADCAGERPCGGEQADDGYSAIVEVVAERVDGCRSDAPQIGRALVGEAADGGGECDCFCRDGRGNFRRLVTFGASRSRWRDRAEPAPSSVSATSARYSPVCRLSIEGGVKQQPNKIMDHVPRNARATAVGRSRMARGSRPAVAHAISDTVPPIGSPQLHRYSRAAWPCRCFKQSPLAGLFFIGIIQFKIVTGRSGSGLLFSALIQRCRPGNLAVPDSIAIGGRIPP